MSTHGDTPVPPPGAPGTIPSAPSADSLPATARDATQVMGKRIAAWIVDSLLFLALFFIFSALGPFGHYVSETELDALVEPVALGDACDLITEETDAWSCVTLSDGVPFVDEGRAYYAEGNISLLGLGASLAWFVLIYVVLQGVTGSTPGKALFRIRVVDEAGQRPGMGKSLVRSLMWVVDAAPWFVPAVGFIVALTSSGHRRVGDMAAGTFVVGRADVGHPVSTPGLQATASPGQPAPAGSPPASWTFPAPAPSGEGSFAPPPPPAPDASHANADTAPDGDADPDEPDEPADDQAELPHPDPPAQPLPEPPLEPPLDDSEGTPPPEDDEGHIPAEPPSTGTTTESAGDQGDEPPAEAAPATSEQPTPGAAEPAAPPTTPAQPAPPAAAGPPTAQPQPQPQPQPPLPTYQPQWDPARNTYIQWDPIQQHWLQWDYNINQWRPIV